MQAITASYGNNMPGCVLLCGEGHLVVQKLRCLVWCSVDAHSSIPSKPVLPAASPPLGHQGQEKQSLRVTAPKDSDETISCYAKEATQLYKNILLLKWKSQSENWKVN